MTDGLRRSGSTPEDSTSGADVIVRAKAALEGVTEGPWEAIYHHHDTSYPSDVYHVITERTGDLVAVADDESRSYEEPHGKFGRDAHFIAASRTLVPELLAEVERLRGALNEVRALADDAAGKGWRDLPSQSMDEAAGMQTVGETILLAVDVALRGDQ